MKKFIIISTFILLLCGILFSSSKSLAYVKSGDENVVYTSSNTKDDSVKKTLKKEKNMTKISVIAIGGGILVSSLVCGILVSLHKPVRVARNARNYLDNNRIDITRRDDFFTRSSTDKIEK